MADRLSVTTTAVTVIVIPAAIDRTNAGLIGGQLRAACTAQAIAVADMTGTTWCDSRGMHELVSAHRRARKLGGELRVARPRGPLLRVWELLGADKELAIYPTLAAATATAPKPGRTS